jgi:hypothetical protein
MQRDKNGKSKKTIEEIETLIREKTTGKHAHPSLTLIETIVQVLLYNDVFFVWDLPSVVSSLSRKHTTIAPRTRNET